LNQDLTSAPPTAGPTLRQYGLSVRALLLSVLLTVLCGMWTTAAEVVVCATQITESVPALPAVAVLVFLVLINPLLRRLGRWWALSRAEILFIYAFLVIAVSLPGCGIIRFFFALLPAVYYFDTAENQFAKLQDVIPRWLVPHDREVIRQMWEAVDSGLKAPYGAWTVPLTAWLGFFVVLWLGMLCLTVVVRRQWIERERLAFPLLQLPLDMVEELREEQAPGPVLAFFRNPIMWMGFGLAALYNLLNIFKAFNPAVIAPGKYFSLGSLFTERPLNALSGVALHYRPEMVGFGYLVSTEISLSIWVFYWFLQAQAVLCTIFGYDEAGRPFDQEQGIGVYLAMALFLLWIARRQLLEVFRKAFFLGPGVDDRGEPMSYRLAVLGLLLCPVGLVCFCARAGMSWWVALVYLTIVLAVAFVYTRVRAEAGIPLIWMFPYYQQKKVLLYTLGTAPLMRGGELGTMTLFAMLTFLSRGYFPSLMGYQMENYKLAEVRRLKPRHMTWVIILAIVVGVAVAYANHLQPYYKYGAGTLRDGIWGYGMANTEYQDVLTYAKAPKAPEVHRIVATAGGFILTTVLMILRTVFLRFPLHPLGYCAAASYGSLVWWSFFLVWLIKSVVFRIGGVRLYRKLIPGFLGFALGHFFTAGIVWGLWSTLGGVLGSDEVFRRYGVWFG
jgi:hypothetical protein